MADDPKPLQKYDYYLGPKGLGDVWTLSQGAKTLRCALATHRLGWELRLTAGTTFLRSQVCKSPGEVTATQEAWKAEATTKGWI